MKARVLSVRKAEYIPAPFFGKNESGCIPVGDRVLIRPDIAATQSGAVLLSDDIIEKAQLSASSGVIVALGDDAFVWNADRTRPYGGYKPTAGDRVHFERYAGKVVLGDDGVEYRIVDDKAIGAVKTGKQS
ncbi:MAG: chaperonin Cpn10 [Bradyrhizobium sp.]|nr:chaperonin Cpn10 [Bradyrhizobium sp.]